MIVQLKRGQEKILWECQNGGQLWTESVESGYETTASLPGGFCVAGFDNIMAAFVVSLLVDLGFQVSLTVRHSMTFSI